MATSFGGSNITAVQIDYYGGRAWFDHVGGNGLGCSTPVAARPTLPSSANYWIDDAVPAAVWTSGSQLLWDTTQKASGSASMTTLTDSQKKINQSRSRTRARGEHAFRIVKQLRGFTKVRYRGIAKNMVRALASFALANLYLMRKFIVPHQERCLC